jgi:hypothetical protein
MYEELKIVNWKWIIHIWLHHFFSHAGVGMFFRLPFMIRNTYFISILLTSNKII